MAILLSIVIFLSTVLPSTAQLGLASIYSGGRTARGDYLYGHEMAVAHRWLPLGTRILIVNKTTGRRVIAVVRDRGPYAGRGKIVDCLPRVASALGFGYRQGLARVELFRVL
jgi:rare lipoprotein A